MNELKNDIKSQSSSNDPAEAKHDLDLTSAEFQDFNETLNPSRELSPERLSLLEDLQVNVYIELGRTQMLIKDILNLQKGYVIELDKLASEPVDIYVNNKKIAEGEVVVVEKQFGIRITNLVDPSGRIKGL